MYAYFNNNLLDEDGINISIHDRSFLFGDNVFETLLQRNRNIIEFEKHIKRLQTSASIMQIDFNYDYNWLLKTINKLSEKNNLTDSVIRIMLTRGIGPRGIDITNCNKPDLLITQTEYKNPPKETSILSVKIESKSNKFAKIGASYPAYSIAKNIATKKGFDDALILEDEEYITEMTTSNIFWIKDNIVYTPSLDLNVFSGITRENVIEILKNNDIHLAEGHFRIEQLLHADEAFLTSSVKFIVPIKKVDNFTFQTSEMTKKIQKLLAEKYNL
jgi:branched-subunit amino acid aminotransferase/4-amino-4-deoxychorismate lyase